MGAILINVGAILINVGAILLEFVSLFKFNLMTYNVEQYRHNLH